MHIFLYSIGLLWVILLSYRLLWAVWCYVFRRPYNYLERYGADSWALITGVTGGIGLAFAHKCAQSGFNLIIHGRNEEKLRVILAQLHEQYPTIGIELLIIDFADSSRADFMDTIMPHINQYDISLLILVAGVSEHINPFYRDASMKNVCSLINTNVYSVLQFVYTLVPRLQQRDKRSGLIIVSSFAGTRACPGLSLYSASKACVRTFAIAIAEEMKDSIDILSLEPLGVDTAMVELDDTVKRFITIPTHACVDSAWTQLGRKQHTVGDIRHVIQDFLVSLLPERIYLYFMKKTTYFLAALYEKYRVKNKKKHNEG